MAVKAVKERLKRALCDREVSPGELVKVTEGAKWKAFNHRIGGQGHWAIYVRKVGKLAEVRPLLANQMTTNPTLVSHIEHINDVIQEAALREYLEKRGGGQD